MEDIFAITDADIEILCRDLRAMYITEMQCLTRPTQEAREALWSLEWRYVGVDDADD